MRANTSAGKFNIVTYCNSRTPETATCWCVCVLYGSDVNLRFVWSRLCGIWYELISWDQHILVHTPVKVKVKVIHPRTDHEGPEGGRYIALLFLQPRRQTAVDGQRHAPAALPPRKTRYALYRRLGGPQSRSERMLKNSPTPGFDPRTVQHVASCYTDWANAAHSTILYCGVLLLDTAIQYLYVKHFSLPRVKKVLYNTQTP